MPQGGGGTLGCSIGRQSLSFTVSGPIVTDCTQGTPPQSCPAGIAFDLDLPAEAHDVALDWVITPVKAHSFTS